jgi:hypothetical protein
MVGPVNIVMLLTDGFGGFGHRKIQPRFAAWSNVSKKQFFILPNCDDLNSFVPEGGT